MEFVHKLLAFPWSEVGMALATSSEATSRRSPRRCSCRSGRVGSHCRAPVDVPLDRSLDNCGGGSPAAAPGDPPPRSLPTPFRPSGNGIGPRCPATWVGNSAHAVATAIAASVIAASRSRFACLLAHPMHEGARLLGSTFDRSPSRNVTCSVERQRTRRPHLQHWCGVLVVPPKDASATTWC